MQDPTCPSHNRLEVGSCGNEADLETAPLLPADSCIPSYVSMVRDHCDTNDSPSHKGRNPWRSSHLTAMGKEGGSGYETPHSTTTLNASRSSSASPSTMGKTDQESGPCGTTFRRALISKVSLTLKNSGSVARDHLASERTFLAYVRTSLGIVTAGVALIQLLTSASSTVDSANLKNGRRVHVTTRALGASTVVFGLVVLVTGVIRYFSIQAALTTGMFPAARLSIGSIAMALVILISAALGILMAG